MKNPRIPSEIDPPLAEAGPHAPSRRRVLGAAAAVGAAAALPRFAIGQSAWPSKTIRIVVGTSTGGLTDNFARQYGDFISRKLGQPVVVENRTGASGTIAADVVAKSPPDGYTFLVTISTTVWSARALYSKLPFDPDKDLTPVTLFPSGALLMAVNDKLPVKTPAEYIEHARKNKATFGTYSPASLPHVIADTLGRSRGVDIEPIHYKGESPMWIDVASGQVDAAVGSHQAMLVHLQRNLIRPVAAWGGRTPRAPEVPTFKELGYELVGGAYRGLALPKSASAEVTQTWSDMIAEINTDPEFIRMMLDGGYAMLDVPVTEMQAWMEQKSQEYLDDARNAGLIR